MGGKLNFWHIEAPEFEEVWGRYKDNTNTLMLETVVARLGLEDVEVYVALEKENGEEYITLFTTVCEDGDWRTEDFLNGEIERDDKIKLVLSEGNWDELRQVMVDVLTDYCKMKNLVAEREGLLADKIAAATERSASPVSHDEGIIMDWVNQKRSVTLTNAEWNRLSCFIAMTTNYRDGERSAWLKLAEEKHPNGEPVFPNAPEMAEYWKSMDEDLNRMRGLIDGLSLDEILAEAAHEAEHSSAGDRVKGQEGRELG